MVRTYRTGVEKWDALCPGLKNDVNRMLAMNCPQDEIRRALQEKYRVLIARSTLSSYKCRRWAPAARRVERYAEIAAGILKVLGKKDPVTLTFEEFVSLVIDVNRDRAL